MAGHTPGPWRWELNRKHRQIELCGGVPRFDLTVMDFVRWGFSGAAPRFLRETASGRNNLKVRCEEFGKDAPGREHHADWFQLIAHPDARLIEAAPDLLAVCRKVLAMLGPNAHAFKIGRMARAAIAKATGEGC